MCLPPLAAYFPASSCFRCLTVRRTYIRTNLCLAIFDAECSPLKSRTRPKVKDEVKSIVSTDCGGGRVPLLSKQSLSVALTLTVDVSCTAHLESETKRQHSIELSPAAPPRFYCSSPSCTRRRLYWSLCRITQRSWKPGRRDCWPDIPALVVA